MLNKFNPHNAFKEVVVYHDSVTMWLQQNLEHSQLDCLKKLCGSASIKNALWRSNSTNKSSNEDWMLKKGYQYKLVMHQPQREAYLALLSWLNDGLHVMVNKVDCSIDFLTETQGVAVQLYHFFNSHWLRQYHKPKHLVVVQGEEGDETTYIGFKNTKIKYVSYAGKPSRHLIKTPCCHLECRFQGKGTVESIGIYSIADLLDFDFAKFWKKKLSLREYDRETLGKLWDRKHLNSKSRVIKKKGYENNIPLRTGGAICRYLCSSEAQESPILMELIDYGAKHKRDLKCSSLLKPMNTTTFLKDIKPARKLTQCVG